MQQPTDEDAILQLAASVREVQDALRMMQEGFSEMAVRHGEILREHERILRDHERLIRDQDRMLREFAVRTTNAFERMHGTLNTMLEHSGEVEARLDDHEARLAALEGKKG